MALRIRPEIEAKISTFLETGRYADADEVLTRALDLLVARDAALAELRQDIGLGIEQLRRGEGTELDDDYWDRLDKRVEARVTRSVT